YIGQANEQVPAESPGESGESNESSEQIVQEETVAEKAERPLVAASVISGEKPRATPAARRIAKTNQVELTAIAGSGPNGRVHV
ncbi:hypothetical protein DMN50_36750, partial [Priestia megaterium]